MTSQDLDNIDWSFLRNEEPWQFGRQNATAAESDSASSQSLSTRNSRAPVLEREIGASSQQPVGRGTLQFAHDFTASTGIPVHSVPTGAGIGWSDTSRTRLHRIQLPAATERSEATYFPEGTPGSEAGNSTAGDQLLREAGNEIGRAMALWRAARREARAEERPARAQKRPRRRLDRSTIVGRVLSYDDEILQGVAQYQILKRDQRRWKSKVYVLVGEPGTGKSKWALDNFPNAYWKQRVIGGMGIIMMKWYWMTSMVGYLSILYLGFLTDILY